MAKLSLLMLYLDVFRPDKRLRYAIYFGIVFTTLFYAGTFIAYCVLAIPRRGQSLIGVMLSKGVASAIPLSIGQGAVNVATDFYILLLPILGVLQLQLPTRKKIGLKRNSDVTWQLVDVLIWVVVELTVGVMCGCMPAFAGFFHHYMPLLRSIGSFFSSRAKGWSFLKLSSRPGSSENSKQSKKLATKDIKMTLGSRVDGEGRFMNVTSVFATEDDWLKLGQAAHNPPNLARKPSGTRREWYEQMTELKRQSLSSHPPRASKPFMQTHTRKLPIPDEESGTAGPEIHINEVPDGDHPNDRIGYF
ncbi:MAG: hypothetical protein Q9218_005838 [Villophora microphyllina]